MYVSTGLMPILWAGAQYIMAAVTHHYYLIVRASLVNRLVCVLEAVVQKELWPWVHYQHFAPVIPNIDMKMAGCGVLMGVVVHPPKITFGGISLGEIMFHGRLPSYKIPEGWTSENVRCLVPLHCVDDKMGNTRMWRPQIRVDWLEKQKWNNHQEGRREKRRPFWVGSWDHVKASSLFLTFCNL